MRSLRGFQRKFPSKSCRYPEFHLHLIVFWAFMTLGVLVIADSGSQVMLKKRIFSSCNYQAPREVLHVNTNSLPRTIIFSPNSQCIFGGQIKPVPQVARNISLFYSITTAAVVVPQQKTFPQGKGDWINVPRVCEPPPGKGATGHSVGLPGLVQDCRSAYKTCQSPKAPSLPPSLTAQNYSTSFYFC